MSNLILSGSIAALDGGSDSAIDKHPISAPHLCTRLGLEGDQQADRRHHGGSERALHYYPQEHYPYWETFWYAMQLTDSPTPFVPGAFGENLSDQGWTEETVHIGDRFRLGQAIVEVSQPRSPCFKLNQRFGYPQMSLLVQVSGRGGWLMRVLQEGEVAPDDRLELEQASARALSVRRCLDILYNRPFERESLQLLAAHEALSPGWRQHAENWLGSGAPDRWRRRLFNLP
ncbi:MAG: MOSC domain-containing protein [Sedimenticola sp.]|nr:MOSC domain-containing protein [Sedimenticola sp.]